MCVLCVGVFLGILNKPLIFQHQFIKNSIKTILFGHRHQSAPCSTLSDSSQIFKPQFLQVLQVSRSWQTGMMAVTAFQSGANYSKKSPNTSSPFPFHHPLHFMPSAFKPTLLDRSFNMLLQLSRQSARLLTGRSLVRAQLGALVFLIFKIIFSYFYDKKNYDQI